MELKRQRGKVSKALSKHEHKAEKKALTRSLHLVKASAAALKSEPLARWEPSAAAPAFAFSLPTPAAAAATGGWGVAAQTAGTADDTHMPTMKA
mmetsp:Transcript_65021/g.173277  ORF Transcript_65021/g.173277 Transcript_65021/m.173277 type:complete len:94 (+) Transcript_65021:78-359(+)